MIISCTPFRVSFFGGGTDFPEFYRQHGGAALCTTIDKYCYISLHELSAFFPHRFRASYMKTELVQHPAEFQHPLIRECLRHLEPDQPMEIAHVADLPGRTGLGSSSAFTVGLLHALHAFRGERATPEDLAREAILVERERVGDPGGHQDQYAAAYGGFLRLDFAPSGRVGIRQVPLLAPRLRELEERLMLFYTGIEQSAAPILAEQKSRTAENTAALLEMRRLVDQAEEILTAGHTLDPFGELLHRAWEVKKGLSSGISNAAIDGAYAAARAAGALGGKLLGAGGRGFLLLYAPPARHDAVRAALRGLRDVAFALSRGGSRILFPAPVG